MRATMDIEDIVITEFRSINAEARLGKARSEFDREAHRGLIVTDEGNYRGVLTERQLLQSHIADNTKVGGLAQAAPKVRLSDDIRSVAKKLVEGDTKLAPVFDGDSLYGIITDDAILGAVQSNLAVLSVKDVYTESVVTLHAEDHIGKAINYLREHGISRLPVLGQNDTLVGIVTIHDIADVAVRNMSKPTTGDRGGDSDRVLDIPVRDIMNTPVETVQATTTVDAAVDRMLSQNYAGLVVTPDEAETVSGIVTKTDVLRALTFTAENHMDVQITNIELLETITRDDIRENVTDVADKYRDMQVQHAHVRFHEHKERLRGTPLIQCQIRLRTNHGQVAGTGQGYGAESAFFVALDTLERNVLELKGIRADEEYEGQLLRKLGEL